MASAFQPALVNKMGPSVNVGRWPADQYGSSQYPLVVFVQVLSAKHGLIAAAQKTSVTAQRAARTDLIFIGGNVVRSLRLLKWVFAPVDSLVLLRDKKMLKCKWSPSVQVNWGHMRVSWP